MEDQLLPVITEVERLGGSQIVSVYRPYAKKWDEISMVVEAITGGRKATIVDPLGETWWWVMTEDGALVSIRRSEHADYERMPLVNSERFNDYRRLRAGTGGGQE
jgi:hypothetical protein